MHSPDCIQGSSGILGHTVEVLPSHRLKHEFDRIVRWLQLATDGADNGLLVEANHSLVKVVAVRKTIKRR